MRRLPLRSPPRMRGKVCESQGARHDGGSIPAHAGKSEKQVPFLPPYQDHPRVCGEKFGACIADAVPPGSPPRMRGKECLLGSAPNPFGITPAYAGKRSLPAATTPARRDHPRVCGEKKKGGSPEKSGLGSPPRMRGKGVQRDCPLVGMGITPACAGKSPGQSALISDRWDHPRVCGEKPCEKMTAWSKRGSPPRVRGKGLLCSQ